MTNACCSAFCINNFLDDQAQLIKSPYCSDLPLKGSLPTEIPRWRIPSHNNLMPILPRRSSHPNMRSSRPDNLFPINAHFQMPLPLSIPSHPVLLKIKSQQNRTHLSIMPIPLKVPFRNLLSMIIRLLIHPRLNTLLERLVSTS